MTADLDAEVPSRAASRAGWADVPMIDTRPISVDGAVARCIGVLVHVARDTPVMHVYLRDARALRPDIADPFPLDPPRRHSGTTPVAPKVAASPSEAPPASGGESASGHREAQRESA